MKKLFFKMISASNDVSSGRVCILLLVLAFCMIMIVGFFTGKKLPVTGYELASIVGAIYGINKAATVATEYVQKKKVPNADLAD